jgi:zinc protease
MKFNALRLAATMSLPMFACASSVARAQDSRPPAVIAISPRPGIDVPKVAITDFTLPNGLRVILNEDHSSPIVSVQVMYHVGSKNDTPGKSGLAHMFEHMLDEGTTNLPSGEFKRIIQQAGGDYAAFTQTDWTQFYTTLPSNHLETALWLEAERMTNLFPALDSARFNLERESVRNEYQENILGSAPMSGAEAVFEAIFANGTYRLPLIGHMSELGTTTVKDLQAFYDKYYVPNNAVLVIAGDFRAADARRIVTRHFSPIPRGKPVIQPRDPGTFTGEKRLVVEHSAGQRQLWFAWRGPSSATKDRAATMALSSILSDRLRRLLINDRHVASFMNPAFNVNFDLESSGVFQLVIVVTGSATEVERLVDSVVASVRSDGVTPQEVRRWRAAYRMQTLTSMQGVETKASLIADATLTQGNPLGNFLLVERAMSVTPAEVQAAARKYLNGNRVVMNLIPPGKFDLISKPELPYVNASRK